jgi:hypothetical protein
MDVLWLAAISDPHHITKRSLALQEVPATVTDLPMNAEASMKHRLILLTAILTLAVGLSTAPASAGDRPDCVLSAFPLTLGVGY